MYCGPLKSYSSHLNHFLIGYHLILTFDTFFFNFRVIQLTPHAEPLRGLVGRCLRQRLLTIEAKTRMLDGEMSAAVDWVAKIHLHLNKILESHASGDAVLSPTLFMDCPIGKVTNELLRLARQV